MDRMEGIGTEGSTVMATTFTIETEREEDGRWIAEVMEIPGAMVYGDTTEEAVAKVQALALRVLAERLGFMVRSRNGNSTGFSQN